ncbi:MAG TPA: Npt1/Npt2 family nucleotide transporter [Candidatus Megaira endosymbiont of Hartmannula sinica]|nr:Npt1/Npt2 family nucleotide transporter [Candidatus Megaera endosymbiont of Hartmannula sinica]
MNNSKDTENQKLCNKPDSINSVINKNKYSTNKNSTNKNSTNNINSSFSPSLKNQSQSSIKLFLSNCWQVKKNELPKFLGLSLLMFCILGIQNLIRATKDSVVNTLIGTETISFLKFWGVMPASFLIAILYVKLISRFSPRQLFYSFIIMFLIFFTIFGFYLFPNYESIHLSKETTDLYILKYPNLKWFILLISNWSFSLFYVMAELWPGTIFSLLFWQFVNNSTTIEQSKRFYLTFSLIGQTGLILSGQFLMNLPHMSLFFRENFDFFCNCTTSTIALEITITTVITLGIAAIILYYYVDRLLGKNNDSELQNSKINQNNNSKKNNKSKPSLTDSFKMIGKSRYIRLIAIIVICYGTAINLVEGPWKKQASILYNTPEEFAAFVGSYLNYTGILTLLFVIIGSNIVKIFGWFATAIISPIILLLTGLAFFILDNFDSTRITIATYFMFANPLALVISVGAIQNILTKSSKYTLFDSTKEMSYVPLDPELKTKGKAAVDVVGTKLGKSLSAFIQSLIFTIFPQLDLQSISMFLMFIFIFICIIWIKSLIELSKEYNNACLEK